MAGIADTLRDLIHIARELKRSVDKIPQNRRNARKLSDELLTGLTDLETFYGARTNVLGDNPDLEEALTVLSAKLDAVRGRCQELITTYQQKGWRKIGAAMRAWRECDQVEEELTELKDSTHKCYRKFTMMAISRLEQPINKISLTATAPDGAAIQLNESQNVMLGHMESFLTTLQSQGSSGGTPIFIQPPKEVVNALYLHQQVETISNSLADLSANQTFPHEAPNDQYLQPFKTVISTNTNKRPTDESHREVVAKTLEIIGLLKGDSSELSVQDGAWEMVNLAIRLHGLEMYSDAEAMGRWTATMFKALVATNEAIYSPYLALALRNLSRYKAQIEDDEGSAAAITECLEIQRRLVRESPTLEARSQLSNTLNEYWSIVTKKGDLQKGLEVAQESVAITDSIRSEISTWNDWLTTTPSGPPPPYFEPSYVQVDDDKNQPQPASLDDDETMWLDYNTARALACLSYSYQDNDRIEEAYQTQLRSLAKYEGLYANHGETFDENVAGSCAHLASSSLRKGHATEDSIKYAERALEIYRRRAEFQPVKTSPWLLDTLWDYADMLHEEKRTDDVKRVTEEALKIIRKSNQNRKLLADALHTSSGKMRKLEQKDTAVVLRTESLGIYRTLAIKDKEPSSSSEGSTPPKSSDAVDRVTVPDTLMDLANDLLLLDKDEEAVVHCKEAVDIFRASVKKSPDDSDAHQDLARGLSYLCYCTFRAKDYDNAVKLGSESITIYREQYRAAIAAGKEPVYLDNYVSALRRTTLSSFYSASTSVIPMNAAVIEDLEMLNVDHKDKVGKTLLHAYHDRDFLLGKHGRVREGVRVTEKIFELFTLPITDPAIAADYVSASDSYAGNLAELGRYEDAFAACKKAIDLGTSFTGDEVTKELACAIAGVRATNAGMMYNKGRIEEAQVEMQLSVKMSREHLTPTEDTLLACRLRTYAIILRHVPGRLKDAVKLGEEAVKLCRDSTTKALFTIARLPYNIESYGLSVLETGDDQKALELAQESIELYRKLRDAPYDPFVPWHYVEPIYCEALCLLATCLMFKGDLEDAFKALNEAEGIYRELVACRPCQFADQVTCWDLMAVNKRAMGQYDEEKRILKDLDERLKAMEAFSPEIASIAQRSLVELKGRESQVRLRSSISPALIDL